MMCGNFFPENGKAFPRHRAGGRSNPLKFNGPLVGFDLAFWTVAPGREGDATPMPSRVLAIAALALGVPGIAAAITTTESQPYLLIGSSINDLSLIHI